MEASKRFNAVDLYLQQHIETSLFFIKKIDPEFEPQAGTTYITKNGCNHYELTFYSTTPPIHQNHILGREGYINKRSDEICLWKATLVAHEGLIKIFNGALGQSFESVTQLANKIDYFSQSFFPELISIGHYYPCDDYDRILCELKEQSEKNRGKRVYTFSPSTFVDEVTLLIMEDGVLQKHQVKFNPLFKYFSIEGQGYDSFPKIRKAYDLHRGCSLVNLKKKEQNIISRELREKLLTPELLAFRNSQRTSFGSNL